MPVIRLLQRYSATLLTVKGVIMVKVDKSIKQAIRDKYAWPGGYPLYLLTSDGAAFVLTAINQKN